MLVNNLSRRFRPSTANQTRNLLLEFCETGSCHGFHNRRRLLHHRTEGCQKVCGENVSVNVLFMVFSCPLWFSAHPFPSSTFLIWLKLPVLVDFLEWLVLSASHFLWFLLSMHKDLQLYIVVILVSCLAVLFWVILYFFLNFLCSVCLGLFFVHFLLLSVFANFCWPGIW